MMNFINSIPENIGWMLVGAVATIILYFLVDIVRMIIIGIKSRREEDEDKSPYPLCGLMVEPYDRNETTRWYKCNCCDTEWEEL